MVERRFVARLGFLVILAGDRTIFFSLVAARPCPWLVGKKAIARFGVESRVRKELQFG